MKYKALALSFLLILMPLMTLSTIKQADAHNDATLYVIPPSVNYTGPCYVSTNFNVSVWLWNDKSVTGEGVYAYDFYLWWQNDTFAPFQNNLTLVSFTNSIPWPLGKYFLIINETGWKNFGGGQIWNFFHEAVTAIGNATADPSLELGSTPFNAALVTLKFHIDDEPFYPLNFHADFLLGNVNGSYNWGGPPPNPLNVPGLSTYCTGVIIPEVDDGQYNYFSSKPNIDPKAALVAPYPLNITAQAIGVTEKVFIHLTNVTHVYGFGFDFTWNYSMKTTTIQAITILQAFPPPFEKQIILLDVDAGTLHVELVKPSEKPGSLCSKDIAVMEIDFVTTLDAEVGLVPTPSLDYFTITTAFVVVKNVTGSYAYTSWGQTVYGLQLLDGLYISPAVKEYFIPKSAADINLDGVVDIGDLSDLAKKYGKLSPWSDLASPPAPALVDIYDFVFIAKHYLDP